MKLLQKFDTTFFRDTVYLVGSSASSCNDVH